jgi:hypothetical protein
MHAMGIDMGLWCNEPKKSPRIRHKKLRVPPVVGAGMPVIARKSDGGKQQLLSQYSCHTP